MKKLFIFSTLLLIFVWMGSFSSQTVSKACAQATSCVTGGGYCSANVGGSPAYCSYGQGAGSCSIGTTSYGTCCNAQPATAPASSSQPAATSGCSYSSCTGWSACSPSGIQVQYCTVTCGSASTPNSYVQQACNTPVTPQPVVTAPPVPSCTGNTVCTNNTTSAVCPNGQLGQILNNTTCPAVGNIPGICCPAVTQAPVPAGAGLPSCFSLTGLSSGQYIGPVAGACTPSQTAGSITCSDSQGNTACAVNTNPTQAPVPAGAGLPSCFSLTGLSSGQYIGPVAGACTPSQTAGSITCSDSQGNTACAVNTNPTQAPISNTSACSASGGSCINLGSSCSSVGANYQQSSLSCSPANPSGTCCLPTTGSCGGVTCSSNQVCTPVGSQLGGGSRLAYACVTPTPACPPGVAICNGPTIAPPFVPGKCQASQKAVFSSCTNTAYPIKVGSCAGGVSCVCCSK